MFQQEISVAADFAVRKYHEDIASDEATSEGVAAAMRAAIKECTDRCRQKMSKMVSVASPQLGPEWLKQV